MSEHDLGGFAPVDPASLRTLDASASALAAAKAELDAAVAALLELSEDMKIEAARRLAERGASAAQLERYEEAFRACAERVRERSAALDERCDCVREAARSVCRG